MSIAFKCTSCGRGLRANPEMVGKKTKCPGCATVLTIPGAEAPAGAIKPAAGKTSPAAPAGAVLTCEGCGTKVRSKPEWAGKAIKCPNCQGRIKVPGAAPAVASPITPAARKPVPQPADDEPLPDDDAGMGDDDVDDRPARKKAAPPPKKKSSAGLLIALLLLVVAGGGGFFAWAFYFNEPDHLAAPILRKDAGGKDDDDEKDEKDEKKRPKLGAAGNAFDSVPTDAVGFLNVKPQSFFKSALGKKLLGGIDEKSGFGKFNKEVATAFGVNVNDIVDVVLVFRDVSFVPAPGMPPSDPSQSLLAIVAFDTSINPEGFNATIEGQKFEKKEANGNPYYLIGPPGERKALFEAATNVIVGGDEKAVEKYLSASRPKDGPLGPFLKTASVSKHLLYGGFQFPAELVANAKKDPTSKAFLPLLEAKSSEFIVVDEQGLGALSKIHFEDAAKAEEAKNLIVSHLVLATVPVTAMKATLPADLKDLGDRAEAAFRTIKPRVEGNTVEVPVQFGMSLDEIGMYVDKLGPLFQLNMGGPKTVAGKKAAFLAPKEAIGINNLKQLALAMHNHNDVYKALPDAKFGAGLSWRVQILPFIEQDQLFKQLKLDEPWDSDHNKQFLALMPKLFEHPTRPAPPGHTYFRVFVGPQTLFEEGKKTNLLTARDGTSNTLLIVEAATAVPWTKPEELVFNPKESLPGLGDPKLNTHFLAALADGSCWMIRDPDPDTLRGMVTANGGEQIDINKALRFK